MIRNPDHDTNGSARPAGPDSGDLDTLYRDLVATDAEPAPGIDEHVRAAARAAVAGRGSTASGEARRKLAGPGRQTLWQRASWWQRLLVPASVAATAVLSIGLVLTGLRERPPAGVPAAEIALAPGTTADVAPPRAAAQRSIPPAPPAAAPSATGTARSALEAVEAPAGAPASAPPPAVARSGSRSNDYGMSRERREPGERFDPAFHGRSSEERIKAIEGLLDQGKTERARAALQRLRERFPDAAIPVRLQQLLPASGQR